MPNPLVAYLEALDRSDLDAVVDLFAPDATYVRPGVGANSSLALVTVRGRSAIRAILDERGPSTATHAIDRVVTDGSTAFVHGRMVGTPTPVVYIASAQLDPDGRISDFTVVALPTAV